MGGVDARTISDGSGANWFAAWSCCALPPDSIVNANELDGARSEWLPAIVPGTVASSLCAISRWKMGDTLDSDDQDWWYRTHFNSPSLTNGDKCVLCFDGLATLAEVWLNGISILATDNMFRAYRVDITLMLQENNDLIIVFRSLAHDLTRKRPRPRWKTNLVSHQQLRWRRTTLLGHIPGWSPPVAAIGPWRDVRLEVSRHVVTDFRLVSSVNENIGTVSLRAQIASDVPLHRAVFSVGGAHVKAAVTKQGVEWLVEANLQLEHPPLWWPHTHGPQPLLGSSLVLQFSDREFRLDAGKIGFRSIEVERGAEFSIRVNGVPIYCRGACWTVSDIVTLDGSTESLTHDLGLARDAGINMLRVGGTMIYESERFYQLCDELGILVWQDFMFANMDYPTDDPAFEVNITNEVKDQLGRLSRHPCVVIYCGNSEVEQQAAMLGIPREYWRNVWFAEKLPALCSLCHPGVPYVPSTPSGGVMPFHVRDGIAHYYGVGAYLRSPQELRRADVKFTPECLAFAQVPEPVMVDVIMNSQAPCGPHPLWKQRVPRDTGAGWDFEDVRDHYLRQFFGVDPIQMRSFDMDRYLQLSRVVTGEIMTQAFLEWRSDYSRNRGALVWFFKDLWPASGWGIVDSLGNPKACYYYLRRVWQTRQIAITDEGLDGLHLHLLNETNDAFDGYVELWLLREPHVTIARQEVRCQLPARSRQVIQSDEILQRFYDTSYAYRFGPAKHDIVIATLFDAKHAAVSEAVHFMNQREPAYLTNVNLQTEANDLANGCVNLTLHSDCFLQSVSLDAKGLLPNDNYFHLVPSRPKYVRLRPIWNGIRCSKVHLSALNLREPHRISLKQSVI